MVDATVERSGTSVNIPLLVGSGGTPLISMDYAKPRMKYYSNGALEPRINDNFSGITTYTLTGKLFDYSKVNTLMELVKTNSNGNPLVLNLPGGEYESDITTVPAAGQEQALTALYQPGYKDYVEIDLTLTKVAYINGGTSDSDQTEITPTATGSGPIQLSNGNDTIDMTTDLTVERSVGRPKLAVQPLTSGLDPYANEKQKMAYDGFEISFQHTNNPVDTATKIRDILEPQLGTSGLTLNFNGVFGLGEFTVAPPSGGQAFRMTRESGEEGVINQPTLSLRRVLQ